LAGSAAAWLNWAAMRSAPLRAVNGSVRPGQAMRSPLRDNN